MLEDITVNGIQTNNLKNISIRLKKKAINLIIGPSGSGKSSLAYDTIAQIGLHEMNAMYQDCMTAPRYVVNAYHNMSATIPIKQINNNNNIHSTIGTYFGISQYLINIFSASFNFPHSYFVLNKAENICPKCMGRGFLLALDENRLVNYDISLNRNPIKCWNKYKDFYCAIIKSFCADCGIDERKTFRMLSEKEQKQFLFGISDKKYSVKYKKLGRLACRTSRYYGVMTETPMLPNFEINSQFYSEYRCPVCNGKGFSSEHEKYKLNGLSIGDASCLSFSSMNAWLAAVEANTKKSDLFFSFLQIKKFISKADEFNLGHLFLNRTIPSLSGGELQRLRLVQVFASQLSDLLIVLDEPLAGLSRNEKILVFNNIKKLAQKHTLLVVDHHDFFCESAKKIIALGKGSGRAGGNLVDAKQYLAFEKKKYTFQTMPAECFIHIEKHNTIYNYSGVDLTLAANCLNIIYGRSGIGKTTLLKEYFPQYFEHYAYINQKPLLGNVHSFVATGLNIFDLIISEFAKIFKKDKHFFSNLSGCAGACPICNGCGYITYGTQYKDAFSMTCDACEGTGFNKELKKIKIRERSIFDIWRMTIDDALVYYEKENKKIFDILLDAQSLLLGHLEIGQPTSTLSGGENIRIKILQAIRANIAIYGVDEPFRGLNNFEIYKVAMFLSKITKLGKTIVVVDHEESSFRYFTKCIELTNEKSILKGVDSII